MKWFKHFSDSLDDPFIQELLDNFGHQGYVAYFGLLEIISKENGSFLTGKLEVNPTYLKRKLRISSIKLKQIFEFCSGKVQQNLNKSSTKPKLLFRNSLEKWYFECPKLLELKDNYTKDLQVSSKKPSHHKEEEEEEEEEEDIYSPNSDEIRMCNLLFNLIRSRDSKHKKPDFQKWAIYISKMIRLDGRKVEEIEKVITWCQADEFWQNNILSTNKLREKFGQLKLKMEANPKLIDNWVNEP